MDIKANYAKIKDSLPSHVTLVCVTKFRSVEEIQQLYELGQRDFGENRVQELLQKIPLLPKDIRWHLIGHLQTNKVKSIIGKVALVHSVDSLKLINEIQKESFKAATTTEVLLQLKIAKEETKYGLSENELDEILSLIASGKFPNVRVRGLMGMATLTDDFEQIRSEFQQLKRVFDRVKEFHQFDILSMGMSGDYQVAVECGSTMVRIGSLLFE